MCMMDASRGGAHGDAENIVINDLEQIQDKDFANNNVSGDTQVHFFHHLLRSIPVNKVSFLLHLLKVFQLMVTLYLNKCF